MRTPLLGNVRGTSNKRRKPSSRSPFRGRNHEKKGHKHDKTNSKLKTENNVLRLLKISVDQVVESMTSQAKKSSKKGYSFSSKDSSTKYTMNIEKLVDKIKKDDKLVEMIEKFTIEKSRDSSILAADSLLLITQDPSQSSQEYLSKVFAEKKASLLVRKEIMFLYASIIRVIRAIDRDPAVPSENRADPSSLPTSIPNQLETEKDHFKGLKVKPKDKIFIVKLLILTVRNLKTVKKYPVESDQRRWKKSIRSIEQTLNIAYQNLVTFNTCSIVDPKISFDDTKVFNQESFENLDPSSEAFERLLQFTIVVQYMGCTLFDFNFTKSIVKILLSPLFFVEEALDRIPVIQDWINFLINFAASLLPWSDSAININAQIMVLSSTRSVLYNFIDINQSFSDSIFNLAASIHEAAFYQNFGILFGLIFMTQNLYLHSVMSSNIYENVLPFLATTFDKIIKYTEKPNESTAMMRLMYKVTSFDALTGHSSASTRLKEAMLNQMTSLDLNPDQSFKLHFKHSDSYKVSTVFDFIKNNSTDIAALMHSGLLDMWSSLFHNYYQRPTTDELRAQRLIAFQSQASKVKLSQESFVLFSILTMVTDTDDFLEQCLKSYQSDAPIDANKTRLSSSMGDSGLLDQILGIFEGSIFSAEENTALAPEFGSQAIHAFTALSGFFTQHSLMLAMDRHWSAAVINMIPLIYIIATRVQDNSVIKSPQSSAHKSMHRSTPSMANDLLSQLVPTTTTTTYNEGINSIDDDEIIEAPPQDCNKNIGVIESADQDVQESKVTESQNTIKIYFHSKNVICTIDVQSSGTITNIICDEKPFDNSLKIDKSTQSDYLISSTHSNEINSDPKENNRIGLGVTRTLHVNHETFPITVTGPMLSVRNASDLSAIESDIDTHIGESLKQQDPSDSQNHDLNSDRVSNTIINSVYVSDNSEPLNYGSHGSKIDSMITESPLSPIPSDIDELNALTVELPSKYDSRASPSSTRKDCSKDALFPGGSLKPDTDQFREEIDQDNFNHSSNLENQQVPIPIKITLLPSAASLMNEQEESGTDDRAMRGVRIVNQDVLNNRYESNPISSSQLSSTDVGIDNGKADKDLTQSLVHNKSQDTFNNQRNTEENNSTLLSPVTEIEGKKLNGVDSIMLQQSLTKTPTLSPVQSLGDGPIEEQSFQKNDGDVDQNVSCHTTPQAPLPNQQIAHDKSKPQVILPKVDEKDKDTPPNGVVFTEIIDQKIDDTERSLVSDENSNDEIINDESLPLQVVADNPGQNPTPKSEQSLSSTSDSSNLLPTCFKDGQLLEIEASHSKKWKSGANPEVKKQDKGKPLPKNTRAVGKADAQAKRKQRSNVIKTVSEIPLSTYSGNLRSRVKKS